MNNVLQVKKWNYGNYANDNYGANTIATQIGTRNFYFSYNTLVAFGGTNSKGKYFDCVSKNYWGCTSGKHLNWLDNGHKELRLTREEFEKQLQEFLK